MHGGPLATHKQLMSLDGKFKGHEPHGHIVGTAAYVWRKPGHSRQRAVALSFFQKTNHKMNSPDPLGP